MDVLYDECAVNQNAVRGEKLYKILNIAFLVCVIVAVIAGLSAIMNVPIGQPNSSAEQESYALAQSLFFMSMFFFVPSLTGSIGFYLLKKRVNINFDYTFVSGELRISKVFNINRRRLMVRIDCEDMIQIGDIDNPSYERFKSDPMTKEVICTPNTEATNGKFFMYVLTNINGKTMYVLECRENLLMNIMKFAKRSVLESDYVMQERKQK